MLFKGLVHWQDQLSPQTFQKLPSTQLLDNGDGVSELPKRVKQKLSLDLALYFYKYKLKGFSYFSVVSKPLQVCSVVSEIAPIKLLHRENFICSK